MTHDEQLARRIAAEAKSLGVVEISETAWRMANVILAEPEPPATEPEAIRGGPEPLDAGGTSEQGGVMIGEQWVTLREQV